MGAINDLLSSLFRNLIDSKHINQSKLLKASNLLIKGNNRKW